jgi:sec-independent protein translocase protein TatA
MFGVGTSELILIMLLILLLFGAKKLPELAQGLGKGIREFKKASNEIQDEFRTNLDAPNTKNKTQNEQSSDSGTKAN